MGGRALEKLHDLARRHDIPLRSLRRENERLPDLFLLQSRDRAKPSKLPISPCLNLTPSQFCFSSPSLFSGIWTLSPLFLHSAPSSPNSQRNSPILITLRSIPNLRNTPGPHPALVFSHRLFHSQSSFASGFSADSPGGTRARAPSPLEKFPPDSSMSSASFSEITF